MLSLAPLLRLEYGNSQSNQAIIKACTHMAIGALVDAGGYLWDVVADTGESFNKVWREKVRSHACPLAELLKTATASLHARDE